MTAKITTIVAQAARPPYRLSCGSFRAGDNRVFAGRLAKSVKELLSKDFYLSFVAGELWLVSPYKMNFLGAPSLNGLSEVVDVWGLTTKEKYDFLQSKGLSAAKINGSPLKEVYLENKGVKSPIFSKLKLGDFNINLENIVEVESVYKSFVDILADKEVSILNLAEAQNYIALNDLAVAGEIIYSEKKDLYKGLFFHGLIAVFCGGQVKLNQYKESFGSPITAVITQGSINRSSYVWEKAPTIEEFKIDNLFNSQKHKDFITDLIKAGLQRNRRAFLFCPFVKYLHKVQVGDRVLLASPEINTGRISSSSFSLIQNSSSIPLPFFGALASLKVQVEGSQATILEGNQELIVSKDVLVFGNFWVKIVSRIGRVLQLEKAITIPKSASVATLYKGESKFTAQNLDGEIFNGNYLVGSFEVNKIPNAKLNVSLPKGDYRIIAFEASSPSWVVDSIHFRAASTGDLGISSGLEGYHLSLTIS